MHPSFHVVVELPPNARAFDLTCPEEVRLAETAVYGIGRYNERRPGMYAAPLFAEAGGTVRDIHLGIDLFAPAGTPVYAFADGEIFARAYHAAAGDYGYTLITRHFLPRGLPGLASTSGSCSLYALHGHLGARSVLERKPGSPVKAGDVIAWIGDHHENGGWTPHVHFQLSLEAPVNCDMPGTASADQLQEALARYPDPRLVLGPIY